jgi:hypothetical protein
MAFFPRAESDRLSQAFRLVWNHGGNPRCFCVLTVAILTALDVGVCVASDAPTVEQFRRDQDRLREMSRQIQGEFSVYRSLSAVPAALEEMPSKLDIPLVRSGKVWRSESRFRADYTSYSPEDDSGTREETHHSVAYDGGKFYEFISGSNPDLGMLRVCDDGTAEAALIQGNIEKILYQPLDSLWKSAGNISYTDLLQRPGAKLVAGITSLEDGFTLIVSAEDGSSGQFEFESTAYHPFGYFLTTAGAGEESVRVERRVYSGEQNDVVLPNRVVEVTAFGPGNGYTNVVVLDLEPLEAESPIARSITTSSFQDIGVGYQVYNFRTSNVEEIGQRYKRTSTIGENRLGSSRVIFLVLNGILVIGLIAYLAYTYRKKTT